MMSMTTWVFVFLSINVSLTASTDVFKKVGSFVQLDIKDIKGSYDEITWWFNTSTRILKYISPNMIKPHPAYEDRMEFNNKTYSLILKNLQKQDSGHYQAEAQTVSAKQHLASYSLAMLDPVEKPKLHVDYQHGSCNVTCSDNKFSITTSYYNESCDKKKETSNEVSHHSLLLYVSGTFIICNASNRVSSEEISQNIADVKECCSTKGSESPPAGVNACLLKLVLCSVGLFLMLSAFVTVHIRVRLIKKS